MYKKILLPLFVFLLILNFIPIGYSGVYLKFDRNEYYETCELAYNMEDYLNSTHLYDFSLKEHYGNDTGLTDTSGYFGRALEGYNTAWVQHEDLGIYNEPFSIEAWIYTTYYGSTWQYIMACDSVNERLRIGSNGNITLIFNAYLYANSTIIQANQWYHVAGVYDSGTDLMRLYINGTCNGEITATGLQYWDGIGTIGRANPTTSSQAFQGKIDEVRIYKGKALSQEEILEDMETSMAVKLTIENLEPNEDITQLWFENETLFEQQTANSNGEVEYNVFSFSDKNDTYLGVINVYHEDIQYYGYISTLNWGDIYTFLVLSAYEDLFIQLFYGEGAYLGLLILVLISFVCLKFYKYSAVITSIIFVLLGLQYFTEFSSGSNNLMWFFVFCWVMPIFLIFAMFKLKR